MVAGPAVVPNLTDRLEHVFDLCHPGPMAGGMDKRPFRAASLAERTRRGATPASDPGGVRRHCWVTDGTPAATRAAGLLVEWRQLGGAWQGRVAYVVDVDGETTLVEAWLPASQLRRAGGT